MKTGCDIDAPLGDESVGYSPVSERQAERDSPQKGIVIDLPERIHEVSRNKGQQTQEIFWGTYILLFIAPYSAFVGQVPQSLLFFCWIPAVPADARWGFSEDLASGSNHEVQRLCHFRSEPLFPRRLIPLSDTPARFLALGLVIPKLIRDYCY